MGVSGGLLVVDSPTHDIGSIDSVEGDVKAGGSVTCDNIEGNVTAGANVTCDTIGGSVTGVHVECESGGTSDGNDKFHFFFRT